jgi:hypothetical protein
MGLTSVMSAIITEPATAKTKKVPPHDNWYTPISLINHVRDFYQGDITTDPASCDRANKYIKAYKYYVKEQNGLIKPWIGNVWCNPPYCNGATLTWLETAREKWLDREYFNCILLINRSDNKKIYDLIDNDACAYFQIRDRVKFENGEKFQEKTAPRYSNDLVYFGHKPISFFDHFQERLGKPAPASKPYLSR